MRAEAGVESWLAGKGWTLVARNVRVGPDEIDLIAREDDVTVVVEVRLRRSRGDAAASVARANVLELRIDVVCCGNDGYELIRNAVDFTVT